MRGSAGSSDPPPPDVGVLEQSLLVQKLILPNQSIDWY